MVLDLVLVGLCGLVLGYELVSQEFCQGVLELAYAEAFYLLLDRLE